MVYGERVKTFVFPSGLNVNQFLTLSGAAGSAFISGTPTNPINGRVWAVQVEWSGTALSGAFVRVESTHPSDRILARTGSASDVYYPRNVVHTNAGSQATEGNLYDTFVVNGNLEIVAGSANNNDAVRVQVYYI